MWEALLKKEYRSYYDCEFNIKKKLKQVKKLKTTDSQLELLLQMVIFNILLLH